MIMIESDLYEPHLGARPFADSSYSLPSHLGLARPAYLAVVIGHLAHVL